MSGLEPVEANGEATTYTTINRERSPVLLFATERTESAFNEIPIMYDLGSCLHHDMPVLNQGSDLQGATSTDFSPRRALADLIRDACVNVGFFYGSSASSSVWNN